MTDKSRLAKILNIPIAQIAPNPHNPRRLFDEEPMRILEESIRKLGILVPLTLYEADRALRRQGVRYILLDGERRWRCAKELSLATVPAIVVQKPTEERNILTMFHIHNVREGWQLMPTALKLQTLMDKLQETNERKLAELTKLSLAQIRRCKILLTFDREFQNMMLASPSERMKADFFIELQRIRGPALEHRFPPWIQRRDRRCVHILLDKYKTEVIEAVTEFRHLAEVYRASVRLGKEKIFMRKLGHFLGTPSMTIAEVEVPGATFAKEGKEIRRTANRLMTQLDTVDLEDISADIATVQLLQRLARTLRTKLDRALLSGPRDAASS